MKKMKFENVSNKLTKEEMNVLKGGIASGYTVGGKNTVASDCYQAKSNQWITDWKIDA